MPCRTGRGLKGKHYKDMIWAHKTIINGLLINICLLFWYKNLLVQLTILREKKSHPVIYMKMLIPWHSITGILLPSFWTFSCYLQQQVNVHWRQQTRINKGFNRKKYVINLHPKKGLHHQFGKSNQTLICSRLTIYKQWTVKWTRTQRKENWAKFMTQHMY